MMENAMMNRGYFEELATEVSVGCAVDIARANGIPADRINRWLDEMVDILGTVEYPLWADHRPKMPH
jgi:hypothetical protein